jgi:EmrB/QacA subfamily drug resistance transporter
MQGNSAVSSPPSFSHREVLVVLSGIMLGMVLASLDQTIVATALPTIARELQDIAHMSWVVSGYLLTSTAATPIYGKLSDLYGRKAMLQTALAIFLVASLLCAVSWNMWSLIVFRALQGLGGGGLISMAHATIADVVAPRSRGRYQGYFSMLFATTSVAGPMLGGYFAEHLSWRWIFWINLPIGIAAILISRTALRKLTQRHSRREIDYWGAALLTSAVTALLLVTTWGGIEWPWSSPMIVTLGLVGVVLLALFALCERLAREPILPLRLFKNAVFRIASLASFLTSGAMFGAIVFLPLFLQLVSGEGAAQSGLLLIPLTGGMVVGSYAAGRAMTITGRYRLFPMSGLAIATIAYYLLSRMDATTTALESGADMLLLGTGMGMLYPVAVVSLQNAIELRDLGVGTGALNFFRSLGGAFGVALLGAILLAELGARIGRIPGHEALGPHPSLDLLRGETERLVALAGGSRALLVKALEQSFSVTFLAGGAVTFAALVASLFWKELPLRTTPAQIVAPTATEANAD